MFFTSKNPEKSYCSSFVTQDGLTNLIKIIKNPLLRNKSSFNPQNSSFNPQKSSFNFQNCLALPKNAQLASYDTPWLFSQNSSTPKSSINPPSPKKSLLSLKIIFNHELYQFLKSFQAGKGRTGTTAAAYLLRDLNSSDKALAEFGRARFGSEDDGVTIPSQKRYVKVKINSVF